MAILVKKSPANGGELRDLGLIPGLGRSPGRGHGNPVFLPGKYHGQRSLADYSPQITESDTAEVTEH